MPLISITSPAQMLLASMTEDMSWDVNGNLTLLPDNLWPNQYLTEEGEDGLPAGHAFEGMPMRIVGYHVNVSRPGDPRRSSMRRQTTAFLPAENALWTSQAPWVPGPKSVPRSKRKPPPPDVDVIPSANKGFEGGPYAWAYGFSNQRHDSTTTTGWRHFDLATGEVPVFPVPESFSKGARYWDIYITKKGPAGGVADTKTGALLISVPVSSLKPGGTYTYKGSPQRTGKVPKKNESGVPVVRKPREPAHFREVPAQLGLAEGVWRLAVQLANGRGAGLLSTPSSPHVVRGDTVRRRIGEDGTSFGDALAVLGGGTGRSRGDGGREAGIPSRAPEFHDAEGKRASSPYALAGGVYAGEEVDFEEGRLLALINERRREAALRDLSLDRDLNRTAYRAVGGSCPEPDYAGASAFGETETERLSTSDDSGEDALLGLDEVLFLDGGFEAVGVARELKAPGIYEWVVVYGDSDPLSLGVPNELVCEIVDADGRPIFTVTTTTAPTTT